MDGVESMSIDIERLVDLARSSGLNLKLEGDSLMIHGPKTSSIYAVQLIDRKPEVVEFLTEERSCFLDWSPQTLTASRPCSKCGWFSPWWDVYGNAHCASCDPPLYSATELKDKAGRLRDSINETT
jgi:hypothetical protein